MWVGVALRVTLDVRVLVVVDVSLGDAVLEPLRVVVPVEVALAVPVRVTLSVGVAVGAEALGGGGLQLHTLPRGRGTQQGSTFCG